MEIVKELNHSVKNFLDWHTIVRLVLLVQNNDLHVSIGSDTAEDTLMLVN